MKLQQLKDAHRTLRDTEQELAIACATALAARPDPLLVGHWADRGLPFLQNVAGELDRLTPDRVCLLTAGVGEDGTFLIRAGTAASLDVSVWGGPVAEILGGRGGGSDRVFQGRATELSRRAEAAALLSGEVGN